MFLQKKSETKNRSYWTAFFVCFLLRAFSFCHARKIATSGFSRDFRVFFPNCCMGGRHGVKIWESESLLKDLFSTIAYSLFCFRPVILGYLQTVKQNGRFRGIFFAEEKLLFLSFFLWRQKKTVTYWQKKRPFGRIFRWEKKPVILGYLWKHNVIAKSPPPQGCARVENFGPKHPSWGGGLCWRSFGRLLIRIKILMTPEKEKQYKKLHFLGGI